MNARTIAEEIVTRTRAGINRVYKPVRVDLGIREYDALRSIYTKSSPNTEPHVLGLPVHPSPSVSLVKVRGRRVNTGSGRSKNKPKQ